MDWDAYLAGLAAEAPIMAGSAAVVALMVGIAFALGFRQRAKIDDAELARIAATEGARVEASAVDANGRAGIARLDGGRLLIATVMADGVSHRIVPAAKARVQIAQGKLSVAFADLGYPQLDMRLAEPPPWLAELGASR